MKQVAAVLLSSMVIAGCDRDPVQATRAADSGLRPTSGSLAVSILGDGIRSVNAVTIGGLIAGHADAGGFVRIGGVTQVIAPGGTVWDANDAGQVVGSMGYFTGTPSAFVWQNGAIEDLGPGSAEGIGNFAAPLIVGQNETVPVVWERVSGVWQSTVLPLPSNPLYGYAAGVNASHQIVGLVWSQPGFETIRSLLWTRSGGGWSHADLGMLPGMNWMVVGDIDDAGLAVGWARGTGPNGKAWTWQNGTLSELPPLPNGSHAGAMRVNERGEIVGQSDAGDGLNYAVVWSGGVPIPLELPEGALGCQGFNINDDGVAGGACFGAGENDQWGAVWEIEQSSVVAAIARVEGYTATGEISDEGTSTALKSKLANAQRSIDRGRQNAAANELRAFENHVRAQSGKHISATAAEVLLTLSQTARRYLEQ